MYIGIFVCVCVCVCACVCVCVCVWEGNNGVRIWHLLVHKFTRVKKKEKRVKRVNLWLFFLLLLKFFVVFDSSSQFFRQNHSHTGFESFAYCFFFKQNVRILVSQQPNKNRNFKFRTRFSFLFLVFTAITITWGGGYMCGHMRRRIHVWSYEEEDTRVSDDNRTKVISHFTVLANSQHLIQTGLPHPKP